MSLNLIIAEKWMLIFYFFFFFPMTAFSAVLEDEPEDDDLFETEFRQYKRTYYMTKMGVEVVSE